MTVRRPPTPTEHLLLDLVEEALSEALETTNYQVALGCDPHWQALDDLADAIYHQAPGIDWLTENKSIYPIIAPAGDSLWIGPRTHSFLREITIEWGSTERNLHNLVAMVRDDQHHLAEKLLHPADAAERLKVPITDLLGLAHDIRISSTEIEGTLWIIDDDALERAAEERGA